MNPALKPLSAIGRAHAAPDRRQMSHANRIDGRGRSVSARRRAYTLPIITVTSDSARDFWSALLKRRCGSRESCALMFDVKFQTACNWFAGVSTPTGDKVMQAVQWWPEDFQNKDQD